MKFPVCLVECENTARPVKGLRNIWYQENRSEHNGNGSSGSLLSQQPLPGDPCVTTKGWGRRQRPCPFHPCPVAEDDSSEGPGSPELGSIRDHWAGHSTFPVGLSWIPFCRGQHWHCSVSTWPSWGAPLLPTPTFEAHLWDCLGLLEFFPLMPSQECLRNHLPHRPLNSGGRVWRCVSQLSWVLQSTSHSSVTLCIRGSHRQGPLV